MINIFSGTPKNMVFCLKENQAKNLINLLNSQGLCYVINCSNNWVESRLKVIDETEQCVEKCPEEYKYIYDSRCYKKCSNSLNKYQCKEEVKDVSNNNEECEVKDYFLGSPKCKLTLNNETEKHRFIQKIVNEIMTSPEFYEIIVATREKKSSLTLRNDNEVYQIYSISNNEIIPDLTEIDFSECLNKINKDKHLIGETDFIVFKIEYFSTSDFKIPIIEYTIFSQDGTKKINLNYCKDSKIFYYIPKNINSNPFHILI